MMSFTRIIVPAILAATVATPVLAATPSPLPRVKRVVNLSCIQKAVEKRENALIAAFDAYAASMKTAFTTRRNALKEAWNKTDRVERNAAIRTAWDAFRTSRRNTRSIFHNTRKNAWNTFRAERRACRIADSVDDTAGEATDAQI